MKKEISDRAQATAEKIFTELCGYTVEEAEMILKAVASVLKSRAVIEEGELPWQQTN